MRKTFERKFVQVKAQSFEQKCSKLKCCYLYALIGQVCCFLSRNITEKRLFDGKLNKATGRLPLS